MPDENAKPDQQMPLPDAAPEIEDRADRVEEHAQTLARQPQTLKDLLRTDKFLQAVAEVGPQVMRPSVFVRVALTAMTRRPLLQKCTRESFFKAMLDCAFYGLEPDGRRAHLIPFKNRTVKPEIVECQLIIDYKGLAELVRRSGDVSFIHADAVFADDEFEVVYGTGGHLTHKPGDDRLGTPRKFYSYVRLKDGGEDFDTMTLGEIEKVRKRSKSPNEGPWVTDYNEMGKKSVFRRHSKWLPLSRESRFNLERIERSDPGAIDVTNTWAEMLTEGTEPEEPQQEQSKRVALRDKVIQGEAKS